MNNEPNASADLPETIPSGQALCDLIKGELEDRKALDIVVIPIDQRAALADFMIVASGTSSRHLQSLAYNIDQALRQVGIKSIYIEGQSSSDWVLLDTQDVIVHLFKPDVRARYALESMWSKDFKAETSDAPWEYPEAAE